MISLLGGPLDGVYLPVNPELDTMPTQLFVHSPEARGWSVYVREDAGDTVACDVYSLRGGAIATLTAKPRDAELYQLVYQRPLTPPEIAEIQRIGKQHGL